MVRVFYTIHRRKYSKKSNPGTILTCNWKLLYRMEFYIALPCITYFEAYHFCKGLILKNMTTIVAIRTLKEDKKNGSFLASRICLWWAAIWKSQSSYQNDESEEYEKPLINFLGRWAIQGLNLARTTMKQMMQIYRNTCDRSVNKKNKKSPKGTTRPPKMNKNTLHAFRHTPWWIFNLQKAQ